MWLCRRRVVSIGLLVVLRRLRHVRRSMVVRVRGWAWLVGELECYRGVVMVVVGVVVVLRVMVRLVVVGDRLGGVRGQLPVLLGREVARLCGSVIGSWGGGGGVVRSLLESIMDGLIRATVEEHGRRAGEVLVYEVRDYCCVLSRVVASGRGNGPKGLSVVKLEVLVLLEVREGLLMVRRSSLL